LANGYFFCGLAQSGSWARSPCLTVREVSTLMAPLSAMDVWYKFSRRVAGPPLGSVEVEIAAPENDSQK